ncbi:hypothetical protein [Nocardia rhizosphaerae]|uniref:Uncharacterized protein n=1 Tax=Nocardia rhizosphaerae TaxID=1691571 RepID=A0ABV8LC73_9NOCA
MGNMLRASAAGVVVAGSLFVGVAGASVAVAAPVQPGPVAAAPIGQPVLAGWAPMQEKPKMITVTRQCDKVKNDTPGNGHSEEKVRATAKAYNKKAAEAAADKLIDQKMPKGYHKRHCRTT